MTVKVYNSSNNLIFVGTLEEFEELRKEHLIKESDKVKAED